MPRFCIGIGIVVALLFGALVLALRYAVLPNVESYRAEVVSNLAAATGMVVSARELSAGWDGLRPYVELTDLKFADLKATEPGLVLPVLHASLSWWSLLVGDVRFHDVILERPVLKLRRTRDGLILLNGKPLNRKDTEQKGDLVPWLLEQPYLVIQDARFTWEDDQTEAPALVIDDLDLRVEQRGGQHRIGLRADLPKALASAFELRGQLTINRPADVWLVEGTVYAALSNARLAEWRRHLPLPEVLREATGNARVWIDFDSHLPRGLKTITADVNLANVAAQWSRDTAPLHLPTLAGRLEYRSEPGGYAVSSKGLQLRTRDGVRVAPTDFSVLLAAPQGAAPHGEITGNAIDLKVMTALLQYFPVGRETRERVTQLAPQGMLHSASVSWTGPTEAPTDYRVKARFTDLAANPGERSPGIAGLTGTVEGDIKGGKFSIDSKRFTLDMPRVFREALALGEVKAAGRWTAPKTGLRLDLDDIRIDNADFSGQVKGSYQSGGAGPGIIDLKASSDRIDASRVARYLPNTMPGVRSWLERALPAGKLTKVDFAMEGDLYNFPFKNDQGGKLLIRVRGEGARLRFLDDWPAIDNINGEFVMSGSRVTVNADSASIFQSRLGPTSAEIDDITSWVPMLTVKGSASGNARDVARYLRESPLREGPGAVTNVISFDGPGKLDLKLLIALSRQDKEGRPSPRPKVSGTYSVQGARAQPVIGGAVSDLTGAIQFTEQSIVSRDLRGSAYGNPLDVVISSSEDTGVVTDLKGRTEIVNLNDFLPFRLPKEVTGTTDWTGRIAAKSGKVNMVFRSALTGVTSALPAPLAKRPEVPQELTVNFTALGTREERITLQLGDAVFGRLARRFEEGGKTRLAGGLISLAKPVGDGPLPEGLWLVGTARELDVDQWREVLTVPAATPAAVTADSAPSAVSVPAATPTVTGFDLTVDKLIAYNRDFQTAKLKGRRAGDDWRVTIDSTELSGDATWRPAAEAGRGLVRARLTNFVLNADVGRTPARPPSATPADTEFPALDITADRFVYHGYQLGKLDLKAQPDGRDWRIDRMAIDGDGAELEAAGRWIKSSGPSRTEFKVKVDAKNLNGLLRIFGQGDTIRRGSGHLEGNLAWPGNPAELSFRQLSGDFTIEAKGGQFAKINPGAGGRLLGLMSLQSIPRRITLDFRDVFSEGFAFDRIYGTFKIDRGVMHTDDFEIGGPAAFATMHGDVSLADETQNLKLTVIPALGEGVSILTTLIGGPVAGLTTLLLQKLMRDPVGKVFAYQYRVTGKWDNPDVAREGGDEAGRAAVTNPRTPDGKPADKTNGTTTAPTAEPNQNQKKP